MPNGLKEINLNEPVAKHVRRDFIQLHLHQTVGEALASIRERQPEGRIIYFYVVDDRQRLQGVLPTRRLLLNPLDRRLADIMVRQVITIPATATVTDALEFFVMHRLLAFPVVDEERRILGVIDVELYTEERSDLEQRERFDDLFQLIGVHLAQAQQATPLKALRSRFPWLLCNIVAGVLAAFLAGAYEGELQRAIELSLFIPVVLTLSEGVSMQSVSLTLQSLHGKRPTWRGIVSGLQHELTTGLLLGIASGAVVALVALVWGKARLVLCLLGGIASGVAAAAVVGLTLPSLLRLLRRDPHVAAGPIALAASDLITLALYFQLARWLLV